jgi:DNA-binding transcriptional regulator YhcF (GntR family)
MTRTFERLEPISKKTRVVNLLREAILSGTVKGGEQIVEAKLAQEFGVGQGLIREALIELEHHGFVQRTPFTGTTVQTMTIEDATQIFDVRIELEPLAFSLAAKRATPRDLSVLTEIVEKTKVEAKGDDLEAFFEAHLSFRKKGLGDFRQSLRAASAGACRDSALCVIPDSGVLTIERASSRHSSNALNIRTKFSMRFAGTTPRRRTRCTGLLR